MHVWVAFSVSVIVCPLMPCPVTELVRVPVSETGWPYVAVVALTDSVVGVITVTDPEVVDEE